MGIIEDTPSGRLIFTLFSAFAQFERDMILTRTQGKGNIMLVSPTLVTLKVVKRPILMMTYKQP